MAVKEILLLGNPMLYDVSMPVDPDERHKIQSVVENLHDTMMDFRNIYGVGRAIAAPQIGVMQRIIYMHIDKPLVFINPKLDRKSEEMITVWDDCMCFPDLLVRVQRHKTCRIVYHDMDWHEQKMDFRDDLSELLQHEYDHLDGILAVSRAIDGQSFAFRQQKQYLSG